MLNMTAAAFAATDFFTRLFNDQSEYNLDFPSVWRVLACVGAALALGILLAFVYMFTHRKNGYSQSYVLAMPMLAGLVSTIIVMMCLLANSTTGVTAAISLTGAFSLVRFRSAPGDPKDIAYVLFAMVIGTVCGIGFVGYAAVIFAVVSLLLIFFDLINFAAPKTQDMTLKITIPENLNYNGLFDQVLDKYSDRWMLRRVKTTEFGTLFELVYSLRMKTEADQKKFIDEIRTLNGNLSVTLVLYRYDDQIYDAKMK